MKKFLLKILKSLAKKLNYKVIDNSESKFIEANDFEKLIIKRSRQYSMTPPERMWSIINAVKYIKINNVKGDFVECGVWRGGNLILFNYLNEKHNLNKKIYGYDTYEGMSEPSENDYLIKSNKSATQILERQIDKKFEGNNTWCYSTIEEVKNNYKEENGNPNNLHLIKGPVEKTLLIQKNLPSKISILRLDTDFYESTKIELDILYPLLSDNGVLIIDDYGCWAGSKKAVDEYFKHKIDLPMHYIDGECRMIFKKDTI